MPSFVKSSHGQPNWVEQSCKWVQQSRTHPGKCFWFPVRKADGETWTVPVGASNTQTKKSENIWSTSRLFCFRSIQEGSLDHGLCFSTGCCFDLSNYYRHCYEAGSSSPISAASGGKRSPKEKTRHWRCRAWAPAPRCQLLWLLLFILWWRLRLFPNHKHAGWLFI